MVETEFKCITCGLEHDQLWSFSGYGNNPLKIKDESDYCKMHFDKKDALHEACLESYNAIEVPEVTLEQYALTFTNN